MNHLQNLLVELFVEELPPKALKKLGEAFATRLFDGLKARGLATDHSALTSFATPRRLAAHVSAVRPQAEDRAVSHKLMPVSVGLASDGSPTPALIKKLVALGASADAAAGLTRRLDGKAETLFLEGTARGALLADALQAALDESLAALPIPKVMQYQLDDGWTSVSFVRPAHGLIALHGAEVVPVRALGLQAGRATRGHRFEAAFEPIEIQHADHYARQLEEQGAVIASFAARHGAIVRQLQHAAAAEGLKVIDDAALLDEVTALVERPHVLACRFEAEFLEVPSECLVLTMKANQRYFPLLDANGKLTNRFLVVSNIAPADASAVIGGNERVVRPRLADAKFFFDQDRKKTLESRLPGLAKVVYHARLGTMAERVERVRAIARAVAQGLGNASLAASADRAAQLAKADLLTDMVGEFPELQGIMGGYYARHDGLPDDIAFAIEDHYKPRFAGDALPRQETGIVVAIADKLETLAGLFGIGQVPSGDKDPFALRRHALGVIRMLIERALPLSVTALVKAAFDAFPASHRRADEDVVAFLFDRLVGYLREQGYTAHEVEAVVAIRPPFSEIPQRLAAVRSFAALPEAAALAAANKRVGNILRKSESKPAAEVLFTLLREPQEKVFLEALQAAAKQSSAAYDRGDFTASLRALASLKAPVDAFFDGVMVNVDDPDVRANRLGLLSHLHAAMNRVADLSKLAA